MNKRLEFFKKLRETCTQESFEECLLSQSPEDFKAIRKEGDAVLTFMKLREVAFEDFPDLLENRLRIIWKMRNGENREGSE